MNQQTEVSVPETELHPSFIRPLKALANIKDAFLHGFSERGADPCYVKAVCVQVEESMGQLCREWANMRALRGLGEPSVTEKGAWACSIIVELDEYLNVRVQGKYYLPAWEWVYGQKLQYVLSLAENEGRMLFSSGFQERCCEIASAAHYGYGLSHRKQRTVHSQGLLMECIQSRIMEELEQGVRTAPIRFADREDEIVVLLQVLVQAAESGLLSEDDMMRMRGFIKIQIEMRPAYKGIDLMIGDHNSYRQAINRQNALLNAALPFFS